MPSIKSSPIIFFLLLSLFATAQQPTIKILQSGKKISIRGLSVVNDNVVWVSGSGGTVARSTDGGETFGWTKVRGYEKSDFRDIEAFDENTAIIMGITTPAVILKTTDGGITWKKVFLDTTKSAFLDAMDFADEKKGIVIGDPLDNNLYALATFDGGDSWASMNSNKGQKFWKGEAFFASSGTNVKWLKTKDDPVALLYVSGGTNSRLFDRKGLLDSLPIMQGLESTGANSIAVFKDKKGVVVGGDFTKDTISSNNCVLLSFNGLKMSVPQIPPHGYRSCVIYLDENDLLTCGTSGIDISKDGGMNWELISKESFHVCQKAKKGKAVFLAGGNGRIAKLVYP